MPRKICIAVLLCSLLAPAPGREAKPAGPAPLRLVVAGPEDRPAFLAFAGRCIRLEDVPSTSGRAIGGRGIDR